MANGGEGVNSIFLCSLRVFPVFRNVTLMGSDYLCHGERRGSLIEGEKDHEELKSQFVVGVLSFHLISSFFLTLPSSFISFISSLSKSDRQLYSVSGITERRQFRFVIPIREMEA